MDMNSYALEVIAKARLEQLRADAARHAALASRGEREAGLRAAVGPVLLRAARRLSRQWFASPRHA